MSSPSFPMLLPLPGGFFRPPAKQLLGVLPGGTGLVLIPEPDNPYDSNAIGVYLDYTDGMLPEAVSERLAVELEGCGFALDELEPMSPIQLGYVGKSGGKPCLKQGLPGNLDLLVAMSSAGLGMDEVIAKLAFAADGAALVRVEVRT